MSEFTGITDYSQYFNKSSFPGRIISTRHHNNDQVLFGRHRETIIFVDMKTRFPCHIIRLSEL